MQKVLTIESVSHTYGDKRALQAIDIQIERGELISLIGPSGAGKTTLLKIIAGIIEPTEGTVRLISDGNRKVVLVFQDYLLFPHMTVFNNVAFGLKSQRKIKRSEVRVNVLDQLAYFGLSDKASKYPGTLSGGEKQRIALARALIVNPALLLLDEPFANLDRSLKATTAEFIQKSIKDFGSTALMVTHDLHEASAVSDRIGLLLDGRLRQFDTVPALYGAPAAGDVAAFLGPVNTLDASQYSQLSFCTNPRAQKILVRAQAMTLAPSVNGTCTVIEKKFAGPVLHYVIGIDRGKLDVYSLEPRFEVGDHVSVYVNDYIQGVV